MRNGGGGLISASGISPVAFLSGGIDSIRFLTLHPDFAPEFLADLSVHKLSTSTLAPVAELRDAWHSVAALLGGEDKLAMALGEKVTHFSDIASAQGETQKAISTALHTKMYQAMTDVDNVGQPGGAPSREAAIRLMSSSGEGAAWLRATPWCPLLRLDLDSVFGSAEVSGIVVASGALFSCSPS